MSSVFTFGVMLLGAYFGTRYLDGVLAEEGDPIFGFLTGLGEGLGGTGGGTAVGSKRRRGDDDEDQDDVRVFQIAARLSWGALR